MINKGELEDMSLREDIERVENKMKRIEEESLAMELLKDARKTNKRMFVIWIVTFIILIGVTCYTIYLLNDIGSYTEETSQEVVDVDTINGSVVNKGDIYGEDKANSN